MTIHLVLSMFDLMLVRTIYHKQCIIQIVQDHLRCHVQCAVSYFCGGYEIVTTDCQ